MFFSMLWTSSGHNFSTIFVGRSCFFIFLDIMFRPFSLKVMLCQLSGHLLDTNFRPFSLEGRAFSSFWTSSGHNFATNSVGRSSFCSRHHMFWTQKINEFLWKVGQFHSFGHQLDAFFRLTSSESRAFSVSWTSLDTMFRQFSLEDRTFSAFRTSLDTIFGLFSFENSGFSPSGHLLDTICDNFRWNVTHFQQSGHILHTNLLQIPFVARKRPDQAHWPAKTLSLTRCLREAYAELTRRTPNRIRNLRIRSPVLLDGLDIFWTQSSICFVGRS